MIPLTKRRSRISNKAKIKSIIRIIEDKSFADNFHTITEYRSNLLRIIDELNK